VGWGRERPGRSVSWVAQRDGFSRMDTQRADTEVRAPATLVVGPVDGGFWL